jgi:hypothetical protein
MVYSALFNNVIKALENIYQKSSCMAISLSFFPYHHATGVGTGVAP